MKGRSKAAAAMGQWQSENDIDIDWYSLFRSYSHTPAPQAPATQAAAAMRALALDVASVSSDDKRRQGSPGCHRRFEESHSEFALGTEVDDGGHVRLNRPAAAKAAADLGPNVPSASKGADDFSPVDADEQGEHVSGEHCSKSSPKFSGQKKNDGQADVGLGPDIPSTSKGLYDFSPVDEDEQGEHVSLEHRSKLSPKSCGQKKNNDQLPLNKRKSQGNGGKRKPSANKQRAHVIDPEECESSLLSRFSKRRNQRLQNASSTHSRKVQDLVVLDDDDVEPKEVNREISDRLNEQKIYYPSRDDQDAVVLTRSDIKCLDPEVFLSSEVINFYIKYIQRTRLCNESFRGKFYIFNTFFFGKLEKALCQPRDFPKLRKWWKGVNIFNNAYIMLPIHAQEHWSLVIICLPPKERISEPIILHLDSLGTHPSAKIFNTVGSYLEMEWRFLSVAEPTWPCLLNDIRKETVQVPRQKNLYDCGIFMLYYIEQFIKEAPARFTTNKLDMFNRSWFKPEEASNLRQRIRELLLEQFASAARRDDAISKAGMSVGYDRIKVGVGLRNIIESNEGINVAEPEEAIEVSRDAANSIKGISVAESNEASGAFRDTGRINKGIKVTESGYPDNSMEDMADVAVQNKGTNCSNKCNGKNTDCGNEITGDMPVPDAVCEITGTKVWIKRVYRRPITLPLDNWYRSSARSSRDARKEFIEQYSRKY